ncbi:30S ribosomal protein S2 [Spiroplasma endosymbiont of Othius punctulatus]|uniref:30S ribosomal protein S2 n=1 Tax=Spiroplasma endosymbiont of Othius punctulatus TaxID=3066289 RepID=UPI0030D48DDA
MSTKVSRDDLQNAGCQYGHQTKVWNPKMKPYIYGAKNKTHIIDLHKTVEKLEEAKKYVSELGKAKQKIIFVGTKKVAQQAVKEAATRTQNFYIDSRWLGGTLTNMKTISLRIKALWDIENEIKTGKISLRPKKEQILIRKEKDKLERALGGIKFMSKLPAALFVVDPKHDEIAVKEARKLNIPVIAICDTNVDPDLVDFVIPSNDDIAESINMIVNIIVDAYAEGAGQKIAPSILKTIAPKKEERTNNYLRENRTENATTEIKAIEGDKK